MTRMYQPPPPPTCGALLIMITLQFPSKSKLLAIFLYVEFNNLIVWHNLSHTTDGSTFLHQPSVYSFLAFFEHLFRFHLKSQQLQSSIRSDFARPNSLGWFFLTHLFRITISRFKFKLILQDLISNAEICLVMAYSRMQCWRMLGIFQPCQLRSFQNWWNCQTCQNNNDCYRFPCWVWWDQQCWANMSFHFFTQLIPEARLGQILQWDCWLDKSPDEPSCCILICWRKVCCVYFHPSKAQKVRCIGQRKNTFKWQNLDGIL